MKYSIVLGLQFGDEGKGSFTNWLCSQSINNKETPLVIRFNGGHQAGHTVLHNGNRHVFSSFGSGTLQGVTTLWSEYCTVYPIAMLNEWNKLKELNIKPDIYFDPLCPITTPYDVFANIDLENANKHGSVGVGFGTTLKRQEAYYKLYIQDIFNKTILKAKLSNIKNYYRNIELPNGILDDWFNAIDTLIVDGILSKDKLTFNYYDFLTSCDYDKYDHFIFEGAQGILLDMDFGFFPNVTRSNTTSKNVFNLINKLGLDMAEANVYYITRAYQTRHGLGFMSNRDLPEPKLINNEHEINIDTSFQGIFRKSILDLDLINYAIECDRNFYRIPDGNDVYKKHTIVITCLDQIEGNIKYTIDQKLYESDITELKSNLSKLTSITNFKLGIKEGEFKESSLKLQYV